MPMSIDLSNSDSIENFSATGVLMTPHASVGNFAILGIAEGLAPGQLDALKPQ